MIDLRYYKAAIEKYRSDLWVGVLPSGQVYVCEITCWWGWI